MASRLKLARRRVEAAGISTLLKAAQALPDAGALALMAALSRSARLFQPRKQRLLDGLRIAFGSEKTEAELRAMLPAIYDHGARTFVEVVRMGRWTPDQILEMTEVVGEEHLKAAFARGKGLIGASAHLGNWELALAAMQLRGYQMDVVVEKQRHGPMWQHLDRVRRSWGVNPIYQDSLRDCFKALASGHLLLLMSDRWMRRGGVEVPFFGRPALSATGPALLHRRTGAPVMFGYIERLPERLPSGLFRHRITLEVPELVRTDDAGHDLIENTARLQRVIERAVRRNPTQWIWSYRRWGQGQPEFRPSRHNERAPERRGGAEA